MRSPRFDRARAGDRACVGDRGSATAETAVVLPVVVIAVAVVLAAAGVGSAQVRCQDAARAGARVLARGEGAAEAGRTVAAVAPAGARSTARPSGGGAVEVVVQVAVTPLGGGPSGKWRVELSCSSVAWPEEQAAP